MTDTLAVVGLAFGACTAVILLAGTRLTYYGDAIARQTGLGGTWMGVLVMAAVTSLPELITGTSSIVIYSVPDIAVGDAVGSCMFNLLILALLDVRRPTPLVASIHQGHVLSAAFGILLIGLVVLAQLAGPHAPTIGWIGLQSLLTLVMYVFAIRTIFSFERTRLSTVAQEVSGEAAAPAMSLRRAIWLYAANAAAVVGAALFLPGLAEAIAEQTGVGQSFVGSIALAASTSMPEVVVSMAAMRMGALDMAAANLFGSNLFNLAVLGLDDVLYTRGPLLAAISSAHLVTLVAAMVMTAIAIVGLTYRAQRKRFRLSYDAIAMIVVYGLAVRLLWQLSQ
jgi:cation:H+ antiporter